MMPRSNFVWSLAAVLALMPAIGLADPSPVIDDALEDLAADTAEGAHTHLGRGLLDRSLGGYDRFRDRITTDHGLDWIVQFSSMYQKRDGSGGKRWTNNHELDVMATWDLVDSQKYGKGSLNYVMTYVWEKRDLVGFGSGKSKDQVTTAAGTVFPISDSDNTDARVRQLYWTQEMLNERLQFHVGQIEVPAFIDYNTYATNDRTDFIAETWTRTTRSTINIYGLGAIAGWTPNERYYIRAGFVDGNSNLENPKWSSFKKGEYSYVGEIGFTPEFPWGKGIYRISPWYADEAKTGKNGKGVNISFEQETPWDMALWMRGGVSEGRRNNLTSFIGGGVVFTSPFSFDRDQIGFGIGYGSPDKSAARDSYLFESYWRLQITERFELTPDIQLHMRPANDRNEDVAVVGTIRFMFNF